MKKIIDNKEYKFELYKDNAGRCHLFALQNGAPVAGFCDDGHAELTVETLRDLCGDSPADPMDWDGQYGDDQCEAVTHTPADIQSAYNTIVGWVDARNGGAWELDIDKFLR